MRPRADQQLERLSSLARHHGEVPNIEVAKPVEFFDHLCEKTHGGEDLPTWRGELYLEFHRGVRKERHLSILELINRHTLRKRH